MQNEKELKKYLKILKKEEEAYKTILEKNVRENKVNVIYGATHALMVYQNKVKLIENIIADLNRGKEASKIELDMLKTILNTSKECLFPKNGGHKLELSTKIVALQQVIEFIFEME